MKRHEWLKEVSQRDLPGYALKMAINVYLHCVKGPETWISPKTLMKDLDFKKAQFSKAKKKLIDEGLLDFPKSVSKESPIRLLIGEKVSSQETLAEEKVSSQETLDVKKVSSQETKVSPQETKVSSQETLLYIEETTLNNLKQYRAQKTAPVGSKKKRTKEILILPEWLPESAWSDFIEFRKSIPRSPFNLQAQKLALRKLEELREQGHDPTEVINQSILNGWKGLFPLKQDQGPNPEFSFLDQQWQKLQSAKGHGTVHDESGAAGSSPPRLESEPDQLPLLDEGRRYYRN